MRSNRLLIQKICNLTDGLVCDLEENEDCIDGLASISKDGLDRGADYWKHVRQLIENVKKGNVESEGILRDELFDQHRMLKYLSTKQVVLQALRNRGDYIRGLVNDSLKEMIDEDEKNSQRRT